VTVPSFEPWMVQALLPEILLLALALLVLLVDAIWHGRSRTWLGWFTAIGLVVTLVVGVVFSRPQADQAMIFGGMLRDDWLAFTFRVLFLFSAAITALLSTGVQGIRQRGEFYALLVIATLGMNLMAAASDLVMLYLAIETTSIPLYVLAGFLKQDNKSTESGLKYFLFGALTSTVMLYGFSLLYGLAGATNLYVLAEQFRAGAVSAWVLAGTVILVLVGFGFKISMVPFHFWSPDVYEGAPTPITAFVSTASKAAGFAVLVRVLLAAFPDVQAYWVPALSVLAVLTMTLGNLLALAQTNIKRLLAYSSIAHAGYVMIGLVSLSVFGVTSVVFYLAAYMVSNLAAFAVVILFSRAAGSEEIKDYAGLSRRSPGLALVLLVALLSLAGMPPLAGFVGKVYVFAAAVESGLIWLAFVGVINAIIGLYYYLTVLKVVYLYRSEQDDKPVAVPRTYALALIVCVLAILLIGTLSAPWLGWASQAASSLF
jgi:NADH-quinone oxidoreductase subunit N